MQDRVGLRLVGGNQHPLPHDVDTCGECQFVADPSCIFVSKEQEQRAAITFRKILAMGWVFREQEDYIVEIGRFTLPRWNGHLMWYLFQCPSCGERCVDYMHGHHLYLRCDECQIRWEVAQDRFYQEAGRPKPPSAWKQFWQARRLRNAYRKASRRGQLSLTE